MVQLLEEKLASHKGTVSRERILPLARILIRNPKMDTARDILAESVKRFARAIKFEEFHSAMYSLRQAFINKKEKEPNAALSTAYKQLELDILAKLKEGGTKLNNLRTLSERIFILDNSFRGNKDAAELSTEYLAQFKAVIAEKPQTLTKNDAVELIVRQHSHTYLGVDTNSQ